MKNSYNSRNATQRPARRSLVRWFFSVRTDGLVGPLAESTNMLVHLIAQVFALNKLIPMDYPGLREPGAPISFPRVVGTAWRNLQFSKDNLQQLIIFFGVLSIIVTVTASVLLFVLSLFVGQAHAQDATTDGMFSPQPLDVADEWIKYLFLDGALPSFIGGATSGSSTGEDWQFRESMKIALAYYSRAILIVAAFLVFYHLSQMVVETAHKGVPMGNTERQIWAPLRLIFAIGLLVPIGEGLSPGQYIFIQTARWGSGLASSVWSIFLANLVPPESTTASIKMPDVKKTATTIILSYACVEDYNSRLQNKLNGILSTGSYATASTGSRTLGTDFASQKLVGPQVVGERDGTLVNGVMGTKYTWLPSGKSQLGETELCGSFFIPSPDKITGNPYAQKIYQAEYEAIGGSSIDSSEILKKFKSVGEASVQSLVPIAESTTGKLSNGSGKWDVRIDPGNASGTLVQGSEVKPHQIAADVSTAISDYQTAVYTRLEGLIDELASSSKEAVTSAQDMGDYGWALAGAYLSASVRLQSSITSAMSGGLPVVNGPTNIDVGFNTTSTTNTSSSDINTSVRNQVFKDLGNLSTIVGQSFSVTNNKKVSYSSLKDAECAGSFGASSLASSGDGGLVREFVGLGGGFVDLIFNLIDQIATVSGVWTSGAGLGENGGLLSAIFGSAASGDATCGNGTKTFKIGIKLMNGVDALQSLINYGHSVFSVGIDLMGWGALAIMGGGITSKISELLGGFGGWIVSALGSGAVGFGAMLEAFATIFLMMGFPLAYILPLVPFVRFFFGVLIWIGQVIESVIAIPLVALAQLNPEGSGFPGKAQLAYMFAFSIFLRPVLMVFGLIAAMLIFNVAANFMSFGFAAAVVSTGGTSYGHEVLSKMAFTGLYIFIMMGCANKCFELITHVPNDALDWMNAKAHMGPTGMSDLESLMGEGKTAMEGYLLKQGVGAVSQFGKSVGEGVGGQNQKAGDNARTAGNHGDKSGGII